MCILAVVTVLSLVSFFSLSDHMISYKMFFVFSDPLDLWGFLV